MKLAHGAQLELCARAVKPSTDIFAKRLSIGQVGPRNLNYIGSLQRTNWQLLSTRGTRPNKTLERVSGQKRIRVCHFFEKKSPLAMVLTGKSVGQEISEP